MKKLIICDSGLGGLDIAARMFQTQDHSAEPVEIVFYNAVPDRLCGYNDLTSDKRQESVFRDALRGMEKFNPDGCLLACNTLSVIYERLRQYDSPPFPVFGIIANAVDMMTEYLVKSSENEILILGTQTTIRSKVYTNAMLRKGFSAERIHTQACPGLAKLLETDPTSEAVQKAIAGFIKEAAEKYTKRPKGLAAAFCCTHYGYAEKIWLDELEKGFGLKPAILNPNLRMARGYKAEKFSYVSRAELEPGTVENLSPLFKHSASMITEALQKQKPDPDLFFFNR